MAPIPEPVRLIHPKDAVRPHPVLAVWVLTLKCDQPCQHGGSRAGGARPKELDTEQAFDQLSPQGGWLLQGLAAAQATPGFRFSVIQMHRPFLTCGDADEHSKEREELAPSFAEYGVRLALAGHLHGYERFERDGMTYITAGGAGGPVVDSDEELDRPSGGSRLSSASAKHAVVI